jgi:hypothetical protein
VSSFSPRNESKRIGGGKVLPRCVPRRSGHPVISVERILTTYMVQKYIPRRKWYRNNTRRKPKSSLGCDVFLFAIALRLVRTTDNADSTRVEDAQPQDAWRRLGGRTGGHPRPTVTEFSSEITAAGRRHAGTTRRRRAPLGEAASDSERPSSRRPSRPVAAAARSPSSVARGPLTFPLRRLHARLGGHTPARRP